MNQIWWEMVVLSSYLNLPEQFLGTPNNGFENTINPGLQAMMFFLQCP